MKKGEKTHHIYNITNLGVLSPRHRDYFVVLRENLDIELQSMPWYVFRKDVVPNWYRGDYFDEKLGLKDEALQKKLQRQINRVLDKGFKANEEISFEYVFELSPDYRAGVFTDPKRKNSNFVLTNLGFFQEFETERISTRGDLWTRLPNKQLVSNPETMSWLKSKFPQLSRSQIHSFLKHYNNLFETPC